MCVCVSCRVIAIIYSRLKGELWAPCLLLLFAGAEKNNITRQDLPISQQRRRPSLFIVAASEIELKI